MRESSGDGARIERLQFGVSRDPISVGKGCAMRRFVRRAIGSVLAGWRRAGTAGLAAAAALAACGTDRQASRGRMRRPIGGDTDRADAAATAKAARTKTKKPAKDENAKAQREREESFARRAAWLSTGRSDGRNGRARTADVSAGRDAQIARAREFVAADAGTEVRPRRAGPAPDEGDSRATSKGQPGRIADRTETIAQQARTVGAVVALGRSRFSDAARNGCVKSARSFAGSNRSFARRIASKNFRIRPPRGKPRQPSWPGAGEARRVDPPPNGPFGSQPTLAKDPASAESKAGWAELATEQGKTQEQTAALAGPATDVPAPAAAPTAPAEEQTPAGLARRLQLRTRPWPKKSPPKKNRCRRKSPAGRQMLAEASRQMPAAKAKLAGDEPSRGRADRAGAGKLEAALADVERQQAELAGGAEGRKVRRHGQRPVGQPPIDRQHRRHGPRLGRQRRGGLGRTDQVGRQHVAGRGGPAWTARPARPASSRSWPWPRSSTPASCWPKRPPGCRTSCGPK